MVGDEIEIWVPMTMLFYVVVDFGNLVYKVVRSIHGGLVQNA